MLKIKKIFLDYFNKLKTAGTYQVLFSVEEQ